MPGFITHYLFGIKAYQGLAEGNTDAVRADGQSYCLKEAIRRHPSTFLLGLQGPDIFFFYLPSLMGNNEKNIGSLMHEVKCGLFFQKLLEEIRFIVEKKSERDEPNPTDRYYMDTAFSYLAGFICHYTLDHISHPYVYYLAGCRPGRQSNADQQCAARHRSIETRLDTFMLRKLKHQEPSCFSRYRTLPINRFEEGFLSLFLCRCINAVYYPDRSHTIYDEFGNLRTRRSIDRQYYKGTKRHRLTPKAVRRVLKFLRRECRFLDDKTGMKKKAMTLFDTCVLRYPLLSSLMTTDYVKDTEDELNLSHKAWFNPWFPEQERRESFPGLFYTSLKRCSKTLSLLDQYAASLSSGSPDVIRIENSLLNQLGNYSYHSGLPCED